MKTHAETCYKSFRIESRMQKWYYSFEVLFAERTGLDACEFRAR